MSGRVRQVQQVREQIHAERMTTPLFDIKRSAPTTMMLLSGASFAQFPCAFTTHPEYSRVFRQNPTRKLTQLARGWVGSFVSDYERLLRIVWEAYVAGLSAAEKEGQRVKTNAEICREGGAATSRRVSDSLSHSAMGVCMVMPCPSAEIVCCSEMCGMH